MRFVCLGVLFGLTSFGQAQPAVRPPRTPQSNAGPQSPNPQPAEIEAVKPEDKCRIEGSVFSSAGEPLKKANLTLRRTDVSPGSSSISYTAASDATGHYVIQDIDPGKYRLGVERSGFVNQQYGSRTAMSGGTTLTLEKAQKLKDINFKLVQQGVITGRVLDEDGDGVQNVSLQVMRSAYYRGKKQWMPMGGASSNDLGEYRVFSLAPGQYVISAIYRPNGYMMESMQGGAAETYAPTYYPSASAPEMAAPIEVTAGSQLRGVDIRLQKSKTVSIRGRILGPAGTKPSRNAMISLQPKGDLAMNYMSRNMSRAYNEKGDFMMSNVTPGSYLLIGNSNEEGKVLTARAQIEVGNSAIEGITLMLAPGTEISGRLKIEGSQADSGTSNARVGLMPKTSMILGPGAQGGQVKEDNSFTLTNVQPDVYDVRVMGLPDGAYLKSIRVGDADALESPVDFTNGVGGEIVIVAVMSAGQITGSVQNEKSEPVAGGTVVLIPEGRHREIDRYYLVTTPDQNGNYTLKNITPGDYRVFAFDSVEYGAYQDPEWLKPFESKGERVTVKENDKQTVQLKLVVTQTQE